MDVNDRSGNRFFVKVRGRQLGPFGMDRLRELVKQNQLSRVSQVSTDGVTWFKASELAELFAPPRGSEAGEASGGPLGPKWYYSLGGSKSGPVDLTAIANLIRTGNISVDDLAWRQGMSQWQRVNQIAELAEFIPPPKEEYGFAGGTDPFTATTDPFANSGQTLPNPYWQTTTNPGQHQPRRMSKSAPGTRTSLGGGLEKNPDDGTNILILGIVGLFFFPCAFIAWAMGANYISRCKEQEYEPGSAGKTGHLLGMILSILCIISMFGACCLYSGLFALAVGANAAGA